MCRNKMGSGLELSVSTGIAQAWPAPLRLAYPGALSHVTARGNARQARSTEAQKRQGLLAVRTEGVTRARWICHAFCLRANPYPRLLETPAGNRSAGLRQVTGVYSRGKGRGERRE